MSQANGNSTSSTHDAAPATSFVHPTLVAAKKAFDEAWQIVQETALMPGDYGRLHDALTALAHDNQGVGYSRAAAEPGFPPHSFMLCTGSDVRSLASEFVHAGAYAREVARALDEAGGWPDQPFLDLAQTLYIAAVRLGDRLSGMRGESVSQVLESVRIDERELSRRAQRLTGVAA